MSKAGYEPVARADDKLDSAEQGQEAELRQWHGSLLNCFGLGLGHDTCALGTSTAIVTHYLPCVTFGTSMRRAFGKSAVRSALLVFTLVALTWAHYGTQVAFAANGCLADGARARNAHGHGLGYRRSGPIFADAIDANGNMYSARADLASSSARARYAKPFGQPLDTDTDSEQCQRLTNAGIVLNAATIAWFLMLVAYGAAQRTAMRQRFGIEGTRLGDYCSWFWCMHCAMCQESRTLAVNNVEAGVWVGREPAGLPVVAAADVAQAPSVPVMSAVPPAALPPAEQQCAAAKL